LQSIVVNLDTKTGVIKPLHGVNNGPLHMRGFWDLSDFYRALGIPHVRLHDQDFPNSRVVDIPQVFPNPDADPERPESYDFERTDLQVQAVVDAGARIVWRLGANIEHTAKKYHAHPPRDYDRWARACIGVIRHYNQGWANGFHHGIRYWEIWNEPDLGPTWDEPCPGGLTWSGTFKQYVDLYVTAAKAIKAFDPALSVGGYAAAYPTGELPPQFLAACRDQGAPLDFFSWHTYTNDPRVIAANGRRVRALLDAHGFEKAESHFNEWNIKHEGFFKRGLESLKREHFERFKTEVGAGFVGCVLTLLQDASVDVANYYDSQPWSPWCGLFDMYGVPQKTFHAFRAFKTLLDYPDRVQADVLPDAVEGPASRAREAWLGTAPKAGGKTDVLTCLAAADPANHTGAVLVSKWDGKRGLTRIEVNGSWLKADTRVEILLIDPDHKLEPIELHGRRSNSDHQVVLDLPLGEYAVALIRLGQS
jgi:hypothetical protein